MSTAGARQLGVEEELFLVDPGTGHLRPVAAEVVAAAREEPDAGQTVGPELFQVQIETATDPTADLAELRERLRVARARAARAAATCGVRLLAAPLPVLPEGDAAVTPSARYLEMVDRYALVSRHSVVGGLHVHVDRRDEAEGVRIVDGLRPWLPLIAAVSTNSPFDHGADTGYASWRQQLWDAWPTAGPVEPFGDPASYHAAVAALVRSGDAMDPGMIYLDARLSHRYPTVEVRVADLCTELDDTVLVAALVRALVSTAADQVRPAPPWRTELVRAARWRARRYGLSERLLDPRTGEPVPARAALRALVDHVADALERSGDRALVDTGIERVLGSGTGADAQRRAAGPSADLEAVLGDLLERTERSCR